MIKVFEVSRPGQSVRITIPVRDAKIVAIIEENLAIVEELGQQIRRKRESLGIHPIQDPRPSV